jgi:hypothetical protein
LSFSATQPSDTFLHFCLLKLTIMNRNTAISGTVCKLLFVVLIQSGLFNTPVMGSFYRPAGDCIVVELNHLAYTIAEQHDHFYSFIGIRSLTMVHLSIHDVLNSISPKYESYAYHGKHPDADPVAAVSQVTRKILITAYPDRKDTIESVCDQWLNIAGEKGSVTKGIALGNGVAAMYLELRSGDGHKEQGDYVPMTKPGDYQFTPGWNGWVLKPDFSVARPFALDTITRFRSPPPPALSSEEYAESYREVMEYGRKNSLKRTEDQRHYAHWWAEFAEHSWNRIGRIAATRYGMENHEAARMFALINMDIYDIYLASLESKYYYDTWRPYTAIRCADIDGNENTKPDMDWEPEMLTPPWPEYPSAHAAVAAGGAEIISHVFGTPHIPVIMPTTTALPDATNRSFTNLDSAAMECADSRIMNGFHFRFATDEGLQQGRKIARYIIAHYLRPLE